MLVRKAEGFRLHFCHFVIHQALMGSVFAEFRHAAFVAVKLLRSWKGMQGDSSAIPEFPAYFHRGCYHDCAHAGLTGRCLDLLAVPRRSGQELHIHNRLAELRLNSGGFEIARQHQAL